VEELASGFIMCDVMVTILRFKENMDIFIRISHIGYKKIKKIANVSIKFSS